MPFSSITITRGFGNIGYLFLAGSSIRPSVQPSRIAPAARSQSNSSSTWFNFADSPGEREETSLDCTDTYAHCERNKLRWLRFECVELFQIASGAQ
jgi:hypothetical protein